MSAEDTNKNMAAFDARNNDKGQGRTIRKIDMTQYNPMEKGFRLEVFSTSDEDIDAARSVFEEIRTPAFFPSDEDLKALSQMLPDANIEKFRTFRAKSQSGTCSCGRNLSVFDIVKHALDIRIHTPRFLSDMLNGNLGNAVIAGADGTDEIKARMPKTTVWIENTTSVPCTVCGTQHFLHLVTPELLHHWVLAVEK